MTPSPSYPQLFPKRVFSKHRRDPLQIFSVLWDNKFSTEIRDSVPSFINKIFWWQKFSETLKGTATKKFRYCEAQHFLRKLVICAPSPLVFEVFRFGKLSERQKRSSTKRFGTVTQNNIDIESWYHPPPFIHKIFPYLIVSEAQRGSPTKRCGNVRQNNFDRKSCYSSPPQPSQPYNISIADTFWDSQVFL